MTRSDDAETESDAAVAPGSSDVALEDDADLDDQLSFPREPIEPETPSAENALFVVLGVLGTVGLLATAIVPGVL